MKTSIEENSSIPRAALDTNIVVRFLTGDDPHKQVRAKVLFKQAEVGHIQLYIPNTIIAEIVFVLSSPRLYNISRAKIYALLVSLFNKAAIKLESEALVLQALKVYKDYSINFGDAILIVYSEKMKIRDIYSYDHDFDKVKSIRRLEP